MWNKIKIFLEMIKFEHTLFALPFAFMGAVLGSMIRFDSMPSWAQIGWIIVAMVGARSAAMGLNRLIDRVIDKKNPRTAKRAIPAGLLSASEVLIFIAVSFILLFWAAANLSPLAMKLLPIAVFMTVIYSYTKRFTWTCHLILGLTIGLAPLGAWVAVTNSIDWTAIVLYLSVSFWTAGFDVIYACQDADYDRKEGLHSIPSRFGIGRALLLARFFHLITAVGLLSLFIMTELSWWYLIGLIVSYLILFYEHYIVKPNDLSKLNTAFFTMNGVLSVVVFCFTFIDVVVRYIW
ncbi:UbiA-like polyprenyltransferase [Paenibacillus ginsengarvi]|uniref:4-hydroxybenzoate polyprenyltransferase n=1 Tax=Paenibacillus ginsengarvi TaxID=400777 RepID=A0A3B0CGZ4_9BACL|nr:UbiA-like polyprenyltransferase [Paenibacillus ginsengarvi]RKN84582.1 4-hydroxybenzoate octaprenyltransferase [Paenibacillus ginsengarvi]